MTDQGSNSCLDSEAQWHSHRGSSDFQTFFIISECHKFFQIKNIGGRYQERFKGSWDHMSRTVKIQSNTTTKKYTLTWERWELFFSQICHRFHPLMLLTSLDCHNKHHCLTVNWPANSLLRSHYNFQLLKNVDSIV